jgi:hypothetical protein
LAGILTDEPQPRNPVLPWSPFTPAIASIEPLVRPSSSPSAQFLEVLEQRRSGVGSPVTWSRLADLLWYAAGVRGSADAGRAGLPIHWSTTPTAGGLYCIRIVCVPDDGSPAKLYDPLAHQFLVLAADASRVGLANREAVKAVVGADHGCTLRLVGDWAKLSAAYSNAESLLFRDAGCLVATIGLCAVWLGLSTCPLGFLGSSLVAELGFPAERFRGAGAIQIGTNADTRMMPTSSIMDKKQRAPE